jgi:hypothetical protein
MVTSHSAEVVLAVLLKYITEADSVEKKHSPDNDNSSCGKKILAIHYRIHMSPQMGRMLSQMNPVHTLVFRFSQIHQVTILSSISKYKLKCVNL